MKNIRYITLLCFIALTAPSLSGFGSFLGDAEGGFGFEDMPDFFGDGGVGDDFSSFFGSGGNDDGEFDIWGAGSREPQEKKSDAVLPEKVETLQEAFTNDLDPKVNKLSAQYKNAIKHYLEPLATELQILQTHTASFALGINLRAQLKPSAATVTEVMLQLDSLLKGAVYFIPLLSKEFNGLRKKLTTATGEVEKVNAAFATLSTDLLPSFDAPSAAQTSGQKKVFNQVEGLVKKTLKPIATDLKKVLEHKAAKDRIETKKKKRLSKSNGGSKATAAGGWSKDIDSYFPDSYSDYNTGGWDSGNYWDSGYGGYDDSFGSYGGYDNYGGYSGYGNSYDDYSSSSPRASSSSSRSYGDDSSFGDEATDSKGDKEAAKSNSVLVDPFISLPPKDKLIQLLDSVPARLKNHQEEFQELEADPAAQTKFVRKLLEDPVFTNEAERLVIIGELYTTLHSSMSGDAKLKDRYTQAQKALLQVLPVVINACRYTPSAAELLTESSGSQETEAKEKEAIASYQRDRSCKALATWLSFIRNERKTHAPLFQQTVALLLKNTAALPGIIEATFGEIAANKNVSLQDTLKLIDVSRKLFREPVALSYGAPLLDGSKLKGVAAQLVKAQERAKALIEKVKPFIEKQFELIHSVEMLVQESTANACQALGVEEEEFDPQAAAHNQALTRAVSAALDEKFREHPLYATLTSNLVPYDEKKYQYLELQHRLTQELKEYWAPAEVTEDLEESLTLDGDTEAVIDPVDAEKVELDVSDPLTGDIQPAAPTEEA